MSTYLPFFEHQGREFQWTEDAYSDRWNWKLPFIGTGAQIAALDSTTSLVSLYPFNDSLNDAFGSNNLSGTVTYGDGFYGRGLAPASQRAQASAQTVFEHATNNFSFEFFLKMDAISGTQVVLAKRDVSGNNKGYRIYVNSTGKLVAEFCDASAAPITATSSLTLAAGIWYYIKVTFDRAGLMSIYINHSNSGGASVSIAAQSASLATNGQIFTVAGDSNAAQNFLDGTIDHLRCSNAAISDLTAQNRILKGPHALQGARCMKTESGFVKDTDYIRDSESLFWTPILNQTNVISGITNKGFTSPDITTMLRMLAQAETRYMDSDSSNYVGFKAPGTITVNKIYVLPATEGAAKEVIVTDGSAGLLFQAPNAKPLNLDDTTTSQGFTAAETDIKTYALGANSFTRIFVMIHGRVDMGDDADLNNDVTVRIRIGASVKAISVSWPNFVSGAFTSGEFNIPFSGFFSAVQTGAADVKVSEDATDDDSDQAVHIDGFYVFGMNY